MPCMKVDSGYIMWGLPEIWRTTTFGITMSCCDCPQGCHVYTNRPVVGDGPRETYTCWGCHKRCNPTFAPQRKGSSSDKRDEKLLEMKTMRMAHMSRNVRVCDDVWA